MARGRKPTTTTDDPNKLPNKIKCIKCGKKCGVREDVLQERIKKHGSLDQLLKEYYCRKCRKKEPTGYKVKDKVVKQASEYISPLVQKVRDGKMWWQQPGYKFPGRSEKLNFGIGPMETFKTVNGKLFYDENKKLVRIPYVEK